MLCKLGLVTLLVLVVALLNSRVHAQCFKGFWEQEALLVELVGPPAPKSRHAKCKLDCMLKEDGWANNVGLINPVKLMGVLNETGSTPNNVLEKLKIVTENCQYHRHLSEDSCETAALFMKCTSEESEKIGLYSTAMSVRIFHTYMFLPALRLKRFGKEMAITAWHFTPYPYILNQLNQSGLKEAVQFG